MVPVCMHRWEATIVVAQYSLRLSILRFKFRITSGAGWVSSTILSWEAKLTDLAKHQSSGNKDNYLCILTKRADETNLFEAAVK